MIFELRLSKNYMEGETFLKGLMTKSTFNKIVNGENFLDVLSLAKVKSIISALEGENLENIIDAQVIDGNQQVIETDFYKAKLTKILFLYDLNKEWELDTAITRAINLLEDINSLEKKFGKCVDKFSSEEIVKSIKVLFDDVMYYKMKLRLKIYSKFEKFTGVEKNNEESTWSYWLTKNKFIDILGINSQDTEAKLATKEMLVSLFKQSPSPQNAVIPLLIFNGIKLAEDQNTDEVRRLKRSDIKKDSVIIRDRNGDVKREIDVDPQICRMIEIAALQDKTYRGGNGNLIAVPFVDSEYVLKPVDVDMDYNIESKDDPTAITYRGAYSRVNNMRTLAESLGYEQELTISMINKSGKIYYTSKYMNEGLDKYDAIRKTLMRFGEWNTTGDFTEEKKLASNRQLVNRLGKEFSATTGR